MLLLGAGALLVSMAQQATAPAAKVVPKGKMTLAWHVGIATRWLDPQEHDGTATPDNFITALHDALIKNQGTELYDHPALAERFEFARTRRVRPSGCARASSFTTASRSPPRTSSSPMKTTVGPRPMS